MHIKQSRNSNFVRFSLYKDCLALNLFLHKHLSGEKDVLMVYTVYICSMCVCIIVSHAPSPVLIDYLFIFPGEMGK